MIMKNKFLAMAFSVVVAFYFGTQHEKRNTEVKN